MNPESRTTDPESDIVQPDVTDLVIRDDTPVESIYAEKLYRLLCDTLHNGWPGLAAGRTFLALANVGLFFSVDEPPVVPDVLLSLDVPVGLDLGKKENNSYYLWKYRKAPDVVIELVSDRRGGEEGAKMKLYATLGVPYYVIFDPRRILGDDVLRCHVLLGRSYQPLPENWFSDVGLGVRLWEGVYEGAHCNWLRWCDERGEVIPTGYERAEAERVRADAERDRADKHREVNERLAAKLRELGVDPNAL